MAKKRKWKRKKNKKKNACVQLSGFATGGVLARRNIVRISSIAARASVSEPPPAAKPPPVGCKPENVEIKTKYMSYEIQHCNYIIAFQRNLTNLLSDESDWLRVYDIFNPLVEMIKGTPSLKAELFVAGRVKLGRLTWSKECFLHLRETYITHPKFTGDNMCFSFFGGDFPNLTSCVNKNETPKISFFFLDSYSNGILGSALLLSVRGDYFEQLNKVLITSTITRLSELLAGLKTIYKERPFGYRNTKDSYNDCLNDLMPTEAFREVRGKLEIRQPFKDWDEQ